jgi:hypothetical protein
MIRNFLSSWSSDPPSRTQHTNLAGAHLRGLATTGATVVGDALVLRVGADVLERSRVAVVLVDADNLAAVLGRETLDVDASLALGLALFGLSVLSRCEGG